MASPTSVTVDSTGISAPSYAAILAYLTAQYQSIYGADVYLGADSQDGQFLAVIASAINDSNAGAIAVYNSFAPSTAQGAGLSSRVKINGIKRLSASFSTVNITLTGQAGTTVTNGTVTDSNKNTWALPPSVTIPSGGTITVTATCTTIGAITAATNTVNIIGTPTFGWQNVTNASAASPGAPVESDAALRVRQGVSVALPSQTVLAGILGAVENIAGVTAARAYENDTASTDANGVTAKSIALVVQGGDAATIAATILAKKTPGTITYGSTTQSVVDSTGNTHSVKFSVPAPQRISVAISLHALTNYTTVIGDQIKAAVAAYINALGIGNSILLTRLQLPAQLYGGSGSQTFEIVTIAAAIYPTTPGSSDVAIAFNAIATCAVADIAITTV